MRRDRPRRSSGDSRYSFDEPRNSFAEPQRDRDFDRPRRSSFDQPTPMATNVQATVKWFNATKGFGFVTPTDGTQDAFLHASQLAFLGHEELPEGATVIVDLAQGPKGPQVSAVHEVDVSTATPSGSRAPRDFGGPRDRAPRDFGGPRGGGGGFSRDRDSGPTEEVLGTVKWYNPDKGFGFIGPDNGGKDIFVHASALQRSGLYDLTEGAAVRVQVRQGQKGLEAASIELA